MGEDTFIRFVMPLYFDYFVDNFSYRSILLEMRNINDFMPKIEGLRWAAITNIAPTVANLKQIDKIMPKDGKWHELFETPKEMIIDGVSVRTRTADSMT